MFKSRWSKWTDISTGSVYENRYLLQARRHKNGKVEFRVAKASGAWDCSVPTLEQLATINQLTTPSGDNK